MLPMIADLFFVCHKRALMLHLSYDKQAGIMCAFNTTSRYLDIILSISNMHFDKW